MLRSWLPRSRGEAAAVREKGRSLGARAGGVLGVLTALLSSVIVLGAPGTALASCGTSGSGSTGFYTGGTLFLGTVWKKQPPGCFDFNLTYVNSPLGADYYRGWYEVSGVWHSGASWYHYLSNGSYNDVAIVTNVSTGTPLTVESYDYSPDSVHVNY